MLGRSEKHPRGWFRWHGKLYTESGLRCLAECRWEEIERERAAARPKAPRSYDPDWETLRPKLDRSNRLFAEAMAKVRGEGKKGAA